MPPSFLSQVFRMPYSIVQREEESLEKRSSSEKLLNSGAGEESDLESENYASAVSERILLWRWKVAAIISSNLLVLLLFVVAFLLRSVGSAGVHRVPSIYCKLEPQFQ
jgi:hypothetical protein